MLTVFTALWGGLILVGLWLSRKEPPVEIKLGPEPVYPSQPDAKLTQEVRQRPEPAAEPTQTYRGFFGRLKEKLRDKTRDELCARLCAMGIDARLAERGQVEEKFGGKGSLGLIEIPERSIRWVNVRKVTTSSGGGPYGGGSTTYYYTEYGVPDARLGPDSPGTRIKTIRVKSFPVFGKVIDLRWEGGDYGTGVIDRLNSDHQLKEPIMKSHGVTITAISDYSCWIISTETETETGDTPSRELWNCYEAIAQHLLAEWSA